MLYPIHVFDGISEEEQERMRVCFHAERQQFSAEDCILRYDTAGERTGVLLRGHAQLACTDADGRSSILEYLEVGDIFGEAFMPSAPGLFYSVTAATACEVLFIDYSHLIKRCPNACDHHSRLVSNILQITARKAQSLAEHISVLSQRTIRQKLLTYFSVRRTRSGSDAFTLPMTQTALADYLSVDRSAMMREMKRMKEEGLIDFRGRDVRLFQK